MALVSRPMKKQPSGGFASRLRQATTIPNTLSASCWNSRNGLPKRRGGIRKRRSRITNTRSTVSPNCCSMAKKFQRTRRKPFGCPPLPQGRITSMRNIRWASCICWGKRYQKTVRQRYTGSPGRRNRTTSTPNIFWSIWTTGARQPFPKGWGGWCVIWGTCFGRRQPPALPISHRLLTASCCESSKQRNRRWG